MKHNFKNSIRFLSVFLAVLFILYTYPMAAIAESPAETEAIPYEPDVEEISQEELSGIYGSEDESTEVEVIGEKSDLRDATVKHYRMSDGTFRAVDYGTAVHFKNDAAEWTDFDNDLVLNDTVDSADSEDFAGYEPEKNDVKIKFAKNTNSSNLLKINYDDFQISFGLQNANKSKPVIDNGEAEPNDPYAVPGVTSKITYPEVFDNVDLVYILDGNNVKEYFVISKDAEVFEYIFDIKVKNVTPSVDDDGNVVFTKDDNTVVYTIPKGYMYDSSMGYSEGVTYTVEQVKNKKYTLTITVDEQWITDDERVYPVVVDPTVVLNKYANATDTYYGNIETSYKDMNSGNVPFNNTDHIYIGISKDDDNTTYDYNARLKVLNLPELPENTILCNASFLMYQLSGNYGYSYTALNGLYVGAYEPSSGSNLYTPSSTLLDYAVYSANSCGTFSQLDVTPAARDWYSDSSTNNGIVLRATNNTDSSYANVRLYGCYSANSANVNQPRFVISYRHTVGIENYYTYETISNGRAGTVYLNANTGQTVVVNDLITTNNLAAPYTVSLVYNSVYAKTQFTNNATADIHTADYTNMKLGAGWKLNSQISVVEVTLDSFIPGDDASYLIFCDGDGTEHYFAQSEDNENIYKDEDGLGLEIEVLSDTTYGKYKMTDDKDNITMFSGYGYVVSSTDSNGNIIIYNYDTAEDKRKLMSISVQNDGGSAVKVAQFAYDLSNYLTSVTDQYGRVTTLGYNAMSPKELVTITCPDGKTCTYYYDNTARKVSEIIDNESSYKTKLFYDSSLNMVSKIQEYGGTTSGSALSITYEGSERTTIKYSGNDGTLGSSDDIANAYHFDYWGRCTNIHTVNPTTLKVYGSSSASYTSPDSSTSKQTNRISSSSTIGVQPVNMLINTGAEVLYGNDTTTNIASYFYRPTLETGETVERSTAYAHTGNASMKVSATTASASELYTYYIVSGLTVGNTYTFSAYAKASSFSTTAVGGGYFLKAGGNYSAKLTKAMDSESDNGWTKLSVTFTATTTGKTLLYAGLVNATGTVYFDDFQLAKGGDVDQVSLISDGGMDKGSRSYWGFAGSQFSTTRPLSGTTSIQINGSPTEAKSASYTIPIKKSAKNTYVYSGWAYASSVPLLKGDKPNKPSFSLSACITYTDNTSEWHRKDFSADYKSWWQYVSMPIIPKQSDKTISTIKLFVAYDYNGNTVYFDNLSLVADNAVSYKYDDNGNVTTATSSNKSEVNATYSGADLTGYTAATGAEYTYTYDDAHNVTSATWAGVTNNLTYTAAGLVKGSTLTDGKNTIKTTAAYDYYGKLTSETDQLGRTETYNYNSSNGSLELDIFPDNSRMVNRTTASNNRPYQVYYDVPGTGYESTVNLSYSKGRVSQIQQKTSGSSSVSQTYGLSYNSFGDLTKFTVGNITLSQNTYNQYTGNILTSLSPSGATLSYSYDILGRQTGVLSGGTTLFTTKYNAQGNIAKVTDAVNGLVTEYMYDSIGRTKNAIVYDTSNVFKQLTQYRYDDANRLKRRFFTLDFHAGSYEDFTYDTNGLLTKKVPSTGDALTLEYNSLKQVDSVKVEHESTPSLTFYKGYEYKTVSETDNRTSNLPEKIKYHDNEETNLLTYLYEYDNMNNITRVKRSASNGVTYIDAIYTYDDFGKLTGATQGSNDYSYAYDKLGNITEIDKTVGGVNSTVTLGYDTTSGWRDRLVSVNGTAITYNAASPGLPATYYNGNKSYRFTWDDQGQLISGIAGTKLFSCQYNADGLRSFKRANNKNHYYYYDGDRLLAEKLATGYILFHYDENDSIYSITYHDGSDAEPEKYYLIKNLQGDVVQLWDSNNNVIAKYSYDPWGNIVSITNASGADISADTTHIAYINPIRYRSYYYDAEFGLYYLQSRYYDPAIGRFISADSLMVNSPDVYGYNLFAYCGNNPIIRSDKSGRFWGIVVGAAVVLTVLTGCSTTSSEPVPELEPEPFDSPDEAAIDFAKSTYSSSMYIRYEYGAEIYSVTIDGETTYGYTNPRVGLPHSVVLDPDMVPDGSEFVAIVHTHPNSNNFSRDDRQSATDAICNSYLVCPNKNVLMFDYRSQAIKLIGSFIPSPITSSRKSSLVSQYQKPWNRHLKECGYCRGVQWPAE